MRLTPTQKHQLEMANTTANDAMRAVAMQRHRVDHGTMDDDAFFAADGFRREVDVYFMLLALRWLHESCRLAADLTRDASLVEALADFDRALPHTRDMRDVREHISHYIRGKGNLQADGTATGRQVRGGALAVTTWLGQGRGTIFVWAGKEIHLDLVVPVAERMYFALRDVVLAAAPRLDA
jgi:hypothetical protein